MYDGLKPINDCLLVELAEDLEFVQTPDKQFATKTRGICREVARPPGLKEGVSFNEQYLMGKTVYFEDYKDGTQVEVNGKKYAFIKFKEVRGYSDVQAIS
jgi:co-chaperonin GroES (HSP10)